MLILDGKKVAEAQRVRLAERVQEFKKRKSLAPGLAVILVGDDPASQVYVRNKITACRAVEIESFECRMSVDATQTEVFEQIQKLNQDPQVHAILLQLPLPKHLKSEELVDAISPAKDADGLTSVNLGLFWAGRPRTIPCTPHGVMKILEHYNIEVAGRHAVVVGRSPIVGKPMAQLLLAADATVTVCHSKTKDLETYTRQGDIVVVAAGRPQLLGKSAFKKNAVVVDVGIHRIGLSGGASKLVGDVLNSDLSDHLFALTPVPGGVGPMTIAMLLENTLLLAESLTDQGASGP